MPPASNNPDPPNKPRRGCLFYGCFTLSICFLAIVLAALLGLYRFRRMVNQYTDTKPVALPTVTLAPGELEQLERRVETFRDAVNARRAIPPLVLTAQEINALIQNDPEFKQLNGKVFVKNLEAGHATLQVSVPLAELNLRWLNARYLNATLRLAVQFHDGLLQARAEAVNVRGKPLPDYYHAKLQSLNLAQSINDNGRASVGLNRLQAMEVQDGKVTLVPKEEH